MPTIERHQFYAMTEEKTLDLVNSSPEGLRTEEVEKRLLEYGPNSLPEKKGTPAWLRFIRQFNNILIYILLFSGIFTAFLQEWIDTAVILGVVLINGLIGFVQEGKAESSLNSVRKMLSVFANVLRDREYKQVQAESLVPGDIVSIRAGDKIPADIRLLDVNNFEVDESSLTGESLPVEKNREVCEINSGIGERSSMVFSGTLAMNGRATGVVVATGRHTELGRINELLSEVSQVATPLLKRIHHFGTWLTVVILSVGIVTFAVGVWIHGMPAKEMFMAAIGLIVAAIPEGLPAVITITLAIGVQRMAKRHAIIRKLPAVETLGSVSVVCSDKTGTLTRSEMMVSQVVTLQSQIHVSGNGYIPEGTLSIPPENDKAWEKLLYGATLCNESRLRNENGKWIMEGTPTDGALLTLAGKASLFAPEIARLWPKVATIPFDSTRKFSATLHQNENQLKAFALGAADRLLPLCQFQMTKTGELESIDSNFWEQQVAQLASQGFRVLCIVGADLTSQAAWNETLSNLPLTVLGLAGIIDPPREEAIAAVKECLDAGIIVKMITGDHALTAQSIGKMMGISTSGDVVTGRQLDSMSDDELQKSAKSCHIFARVSPEHKLKLVKALQSQNLVVAMTGDGVNDSPALRRADVGIAMGIKGTEAAKEASQMVLADDNFASIVSSVEEGRTVYNNIKKTLIFMMPTNGGQSLVILTAVLAGIVLPISALQILWVNMITAVTLGLAVAFEPMEKGTMKKPPRSSHEPLLSLPDVARILFVSTLFTVMTLIMFSLFREKGDDYARTVAVNTLVFGEIFYLFSARKREESSFSISGLIATPIVWITVGATLLAQFLFTYLPTLQELFHTESLEAMAWLKILGISLLFFIIIELEKALSTRTQKRK